MPHRPAFTRTDTLAAVCLMTVACSLSHALFAEEGKTKSDQRASQAATKMQIVHAGNVLWANGNRDWYAGISAKGELLDEKLAVIKGSTFNVKSTSGADPVYRVAKLLNGNYFDAADLISPFEAKDRKAPRAGEEMTKDNMSFAMLRIDNGAKRAQEWKMTHNARAALVSDRNTGKGAGKDARSIVKPDGDAWLGGVVYNDNHADLAVKHVLKVTEYMQSGEVKDDDLFAEDKNSRGVEGADAAMVFQDAKTYVEQK